METHSQEWIEASLTRLEQLEQDKQQLEAELEGSRARRDELTGEADESASRGDSLALEHQTMAGELEDLATQRAQLVASRDGLNSELQALEVQESAATAASEESSTRLRVLRDEDSQRARRIDQAEAECAELDRTAAAVSAEIAELYLKLERAAEEAEQTNPEQEQVRTSAVVMAPVEADVTEPKKATVFPEVAAAQAGTPPGAAAPTVAEAQKKTETQDEAWEAMLASHGAALDEELTAPSRPPTPSSAAPLAPSRPPTPSPRPPTPSSHSPSVVVAPGLMETAEDPPGTSSFSRPGELTAEDDLVTYGARAGGSLKTWAIFGAAAVVLLAGGFFLLGGDDAAPAASAVEATGVRSADVTPSADPGPEAAPEALAAAEEAAKAPQPRKKKRRKSKKKKKKKTGKKTGKK